MKPPLKDDPKTYPVAARLFAWVRHPRAANGVMVGLVLVCLILAALNFTYDSHARFSVERVPVFFGLFGFVGFTGLILLARALRALIKRPEDFYGDKAIDREDYPVEQTDQVQSHAD